MLWCIELCNPKLVFKVRCPLQLLGVRAQSSQRPVPGWGVGLGVLSQAFGDWLYVEV